MSADPTEYDYWRDAICMAVVDSLDRETVFSALRLSETAAQFNYAIWASSRLKDIMEGDDAQEM